MFSELRPVGNRLALESSPMDDKAFAPFKFLGYQSGTAALAAVLISVRKTQPLVKSPTVLLPAYTCPDVISACLFANIQPKMVDFEADSCWMDLNDLKTKIDSSCIAVIAINFLGIPERIKSIRSVVNDSSIIQTDITIIEDSAQGMSTKKSNEFWHGDIVICSFGRGKPLNLMGGGGIIYDPIKLSRKTLDILTKMVPVANSEQNTFSNILYTIKVKLFNIFTFPFFYYFLSKLPFLKLGSTTFHPLDKLKAMPLPIKNQFNINYKIYIDGQSMRAKYEQLFNSLNSKHFLSLSLQSKILENLPLLRYPLLVKDKKVRDLIYHDLSKAGLGVSKLYQQILPNIEGIQRSMFREVVNYPNADQFAATLLTLPMHEDVKDEHIAKMKSIFLKYL